MGVAAPQESAGRGNRGGRVCGIWLEEEPASCVCWMEHACRHHHGANRSLGGRRDGAAGQCNGSMVVADGGGTGCHRETGELAGGRGRTQIWWVRAQWRWAELDEEEFHKSSQHRDGHQTRAEQAAGLLQVGGAKIKAVMIIMRISNRKWRSQPSRHMGCLRKHLQEAGLAPAGHCIPVGGVSEAEGLCCGRRWEERPAG